MNPLSPPTNTSNVGGGVHILLPPAATSTSYGWVGVVQKQSYPPVAKLSLEPKWPPGTTNQPSSYTNFTVMQSNSCFIRLVRHFSCSHHPTLRHLFVTLVGGSLEPSFPTYQHIQCWRWGSYPFTTSRNFHLPATARLYTLHKSLLLGCSRTHSD